MRQLLTHLPDTAGERLATPPELRHRMERVLRLPVGAQLLLADGRGRTLPCSWGPEWLEVVGPMTVHPARQPQVTLAAGLIKGERWDWLVEKAAELGADDLQPLACDHSVVRVESAKAADKTARWQAIAQEAFEQCGRPWLCRVAPPVPLATWLGSLSATAVLVCDERMPPLALWDAVRAAAEASQAPGRLAVIVGPEGGLSQAERELLDSLEVTRVCLSNSVLRAETAGLAALTIVSAALRR